MAPSVKITGLVIAHRTPVAPRIGGNAVRMGTLTDLPCLTNSTVG